MFQSIASREKGRHINSLVKTTKWLNRGVELEVIKQEHTAAEFFFFLNIFKLIFCSCFRRKVCLQKPTVGN